MGDLEGEKPPSKISYTTENLSRRSSYTSRGEASENGLVVGSEVALEHLHQVEQEVEDEA